MEKDALDQFYNDNCSKEHIKHCNENPFYTENTSTCQSMLGPHRVIPYHWKGMNDEQKRTILQEQERMRSDKLSQKELEKEEERLWALQQEEIRRQQVLLSKQHQVGKCKTYNEIVEFNKLKAKEDDVRGSEMYEQTHDYKVF